MVINSFNNISYYLADFNGDVDANDATMIQKYLSDLIDYFG